MLKRLITNINQSLKTNAYVCSYNSFLAGWLSFIWHPFYWFLWTYIYPENIDSIFFRFSSSILGLGLILKKFWPKTLLKYFPLYWFFFVLWILPITFTYLGLANNFTDPWIVCEIMAIFFVILLNYSWIGSFITLFLGTLLGILFFYLSNHHSMMAIEQRHIESALPTIFVIFAGTLFAHFGRLGVSGYLKQTLQKEAEFAIKLEQQKSAILQSLSGSIAHEIRNPLNNINLSANIISQLATNLNTVNTSNSSSVAFAITNTKQELINVKSAISASIKQANETINIILSDLSEKPIDPADFKVLPAKQTLSEIIEHFGYASQAEREKVKILIKESFFDDYSSGSGLETSSGLKTSSDLNTNYNLYFKTIPERFTFIVYNLLKNALYYLKQYPDSVISIGTEQRIIKDKEYNAIYVYDTGPGVPPEIMPKLFGSFFTSGKKGGTGLGLDFCKRNMQIFNGDIICESNYAPKDMVKDQNLSDQSWSKFSMLFPKLSQAEIAFAQEQAKQNSSQNNQKNNSGLGNYEQYLKQLQGLNILLVDDQEMNRMITKKTLENYGLNILTATNGKELVEIYQQNLEENKKDSTKPLFNLIITDINMPPYNGDEAAKQIRAIEQQNNNNKPIPIIAMSGDGSPEDIKHFLDCGITDCFIKGSDTELLVKLIAFVML